MKQDVYFIVRLEFFKKMMEKQNLIIKEMTEKKHSFDEIKQTLNQKFGECAYKDSTIYEKMRLVRGNQNITER